MIFCLMQPLISHPRRSLNVYRKVMGFRQYHLCVLSLSNTLTVSLLMLKAGLLFWVIWSRSPGVNLIVFLPSFIFQ